ncbi:hypothetical protein [Mycoplasma sp. OR1901]|uniref:hypothetical protein n=1 Tax=Mycoplasma sp. OR1901 TaxID=2742195 RepID=UPI001581E657|nr:hypothetical protein [Mycoplasma sp. OR1901]QKT05254.1 hypothetical protein HTZ87_00845 [Mycoplasma sp. OR1901]
MKKKLWYLVPVSIVSATTITMVASSSVDKQVYLNNSLAQIDSSYQLNNPKKYYAQEWMSEIPDNRSIFSLSIPGTHDSAMYNGTGIAYTFASNYAKTQYFDFANQLNLGIRAFDLRVNNEGWLVHGATYSRQKLDEAMNSFSHFLSEHPSEFLVIRIKDENFNVNNSRYATSANNNYQNVLQKFNNYLYNPEGKSFSDLKNDKGFKIKEFRGKMVILNHWHHKVNNTPNGGFMFRSVSYDSIIQDRYDGINSIDEKVSLIRDMMHKASSINRDEDVFYINFTSMASGWRPFKSSREVNKKINELLIKENTLHNLGIVYMDFPGPSLIQSVYKNNFYYSKDELEKGLLEKNIKDLNISQVYNDDNRIVLKTTNNPSDYQNLFLELYKDGNLVKNEKIPSNFNETEYIISLDNDQQLDSAHHWSLKSYRKTENNVWYPQQIYNELNIENINIQIHPIVIEQQKLINDIKKYQSYYKVQYPDIYTFLETQFINYLKNIDRHKPETFSNFNNLKNYWKTISNNLYRLYELMNKFNDSFYNLNNLNLEKFLNSSNVIFVIKLKTEIYKRIKSIFLSKNSYLIDDNELNNLVKEVSQKNSIINHLTSMIFDIENLNLNEDIDNFKNIYPNFDFAKNNFIQQVKSQTNEVNIILEKLFQKSTNTSVFQENYSIINNYIDALKSTKSKIKNATKFISELNSFFSNENYLYLLPFYKQDIINSLNQLTFESNPIIQNAHTFDEDYKKIKSTIEKSEPFLSMYKNHLFQSANLQNYKILINEIQKTLNEKDPKSLTLKFIQEKNVEIQKLQNIILSNESEFDKNREKIDNNVVISKTQKNFLIQQLENLLNLKTENIQLLIDKLKDFEDWYKQFNELSFLNDTQKSFYLEKLKQYTDLFSIQNNFKTWADLNEKMQELSELTKQLENYNTFNGFLILDQQKREESSDFIDKVLENWKISNWDLNNISLKIKQLKDYLDLFKKLPSIKNAKLKLENIENLYDFERNILLDDLDKVYNFGALDNWYKKLENAEKNSWKIRDTQDFEHLTPSQALSVQETLANSTSFDEYKKMRDNYLEFDKLKSRGDIFVKSLNNLKNMPFYINNFLESKTNIIKELEKLKEMLVQDLDFNAVTKQLELTKKRYEELKQSSNKYHQNELIKEAVNTYDNTYKEVLNFQKILQDKIYEGLVNKINNYLKDNFLNPKNNDINFIKEKIINLEKKYAEWKNDKIKLNQQYNDEQKNKKDIEIFNAYAKKFKFTLSDEVYNSSPSSVATKDLNPNQYDDTYKIVNLTLIPNDKIKILKLNYEIRKNELIYFKQQIFDGFISKDETQTETINKTIVPLMSSKEHNTSTSLSNKYLWFLVFPIIGTIILVIILIYKKIIIKNKRKLNS